MPALPNMSSSKPALPPEPIGWSWLAVPDSDGNWIYPALAESLRNQIRIILATAPGEQLMHPEFGAGLETMLYEPDTTATRARIRERIAEGLKLWEPRIVVDSITVSPARDPREILIAIAYRAAHSGQAGSLSFGMTVGAA